MKISIITVAYNSSATISDTIKSVLDQTYLDIEYIIVDGNSKDNTMSIVKDYEPIFNGRMHWISEPDKGLYDAMNKGIQMATGEVIGIINSDDFYVNNSVIEEVIKTIKIRNVDSLYTDLYLVDSTDTDKVIRDCTYRDFKKGLFFQGWHPPHPSFFVKRKIYDKYGKFDLTYSIAADYDFMLRVLEKHSITTTYLPIHTIKMRNGGASTSSLKHIKISQKECLLAFKKNDLSVNKWGYFIGKYQQKLRQYSFRSLIQDVRSKK
jgi:glycosyltransferase involved in cell wall biosynthesis